MRLLSGEGLQESDNFGVIFLAEFVAQLQTTHGIHCLFQSRRGAIVKIRISQLNISQCGYLEHEAIGILARYRESAFCLAGGFVRFMYPHLLIRASADSRAVMAAHAALLLE